MEKAHKKLSWRNWESMQSVGLLEIAQLGFTEYCIALANKRSMHVCVPKWQESTVLDSEYLLQYVILIPLDRA